MTEENQTYLINDNKDFSRFMKEERLRRGMDQKDFGALMGYTHSYISGRESMNPDKTGIHLATVLYILNKVGWRLMIVRKSRAD